MNQIFKPVIVALDFSSLDQALAIADALDPESCRVKIGKELFTRAGPQSVRALHLRGFEVFLDLKFHDIPNTVAGACRAAADLGCWMVNVHASGGRAMMHAAADAFATLNQPPLLIGVTVLTSLDRAALGEVGISAGTDTQVVRLAQLAESCGLNGVVSSPLEIEPLRASVAADFALVTPGVRPAGTARDDQVRIATPGEALRSGANFLVIGRPITRAKVPHEALAQVVAECLAAVAH